MMEWTVDVEDELSAPLLESILQGPIFDIKDGKAIRMLTEETVERVNGLKIQIFSNEHPPPHFRVVYQSSSANYDIASCSRLNGSGDVLRYEKNIRVWWDENKAKLIETWNRLRPSDCPVGRYHE
jgi:Domain of unknown function (DUF4160)